MNNTDLLLVGNIVAGIFYFLTEAGAVSALPAHLMSDHVFLGSSMVAMLSAEAVLLAKDIRCCQHAVSQWSVILLLQCSTCLLRLLAYAAYHTLLAICISLVFLKHA